MICKRSIEAVCEYDENIIKVDIFYPIEITNLIRDFDVLEGFQLNRFCEFLDAKSMIIIDRINKRLVIYQGEMLYFIDDNNKLSMDFFNNTFDFNGDNFSNCSKEDKMTGYGELLAFLTSYRGLDEYLPRGKQVCYLDAFLGIVDINKYNVVAKSNRVLLCLPKFRDVTPEWMLLTIVDALTMENIGSIELNMNRKGESNFSYKGNVAYEVREKYQHQGYATESLRVLNDYIKNLSDEYNKALYVAMEYHNKISERVAVKNGGELVFSGDVPASETINFIGKIRKVKIYRIIN